MTDIITRWKQQDEQSLARIRAFNERFFGAQEWGRVRTQKTVTEPQDTVEPFVLADQRKQELIAGEKSFERSMSPQDSAMLRQATRGESYRMDDAA
jgi:hypothetical protein